MNIYLLKTVYIYYLLSADTRKRGWKNTICHFEIPILYLEMNLLLAIQFDNIRILDCLSSISRIHNPQNTLFEWR